MYKTFIVCLSVLILSGCSNPEKTTEVLQQNGYENIEVLSGWRFGLRWCGKGVPYDDFIATKNGKNISGYVCHNFLFGESIHEKD